MTRSVEEIVGLKIQDYLAEHVDATTIGQDNTLDLDELHQMIATGKFSAVEGITQPPAEDDYILINDDPADGCREVTMQPDGIKRKIDIVIGSLEDIKRWIESEFKVDFSKRDILAQDDLFIYWSDEAGLTKGNVKYFDEDSTPRFAHDEALVVREAEILAFAQDTLSSNRLRISKVL